MFSSVVFVLSLIALGKGCSLCINACNTDTKCQSLMKFCAYFIIILSFVATAFSGYKMVKHCAYGLKEACPFHHKHGAKGMEDSMHHDTNTEDHDAGSNVDTP